MKPLIGRALQGGMVVRPGLIRVPGRVPYGLTAVRRDGLGLVELALQDPGRFTPEVAARAAALLRQWRSARVGGCWWGAAAPVSAAGRAVVFAAAARRDTLALLDMAGPGAVLVAGRQAGWAAECRRREVELVAGPVDPWPLLEAAGSVHAAGRDEVALLAGLLGRTVVCRGPGPLSLTRDPVRLMAAVLHGTWFTDPFSGAAVDCEGFLRLLAEWRQQNAAAAAIGCCVGISFWKRRRIAAMLGGERRMSFRRTARASVRAAVRTGGGIAVWPSRAPAGLDGAAAAAGVAVSRVEDGFIRSRGLGADFLPPFSVVLDRLGLYYDATGPSELEAILLQDPFEPTLLRRAAALRARLVRDGVTKYNLSGMVTISPPPGRRVVLVPGQVADDRSVLLGGGGVRPGLDLLRRVRARAPEAWIIYKPHPDVEAGHRAGAVADHDVLALADQVLRGGSMAELLGQVDEVHTLTSLTGFEALLRGVPVVTYGQPFYAGWGLTTDDNPPPGRGRALSLDALVAGTLILYPRYFDPVLRLPCGPEIVLDRLADPALQGVNLLVMVRRLQGRAAMLLRRWARNGFGPSSSPPVRDRVR